MLGNEVSTIYEIVRYFGTQHSTAIQTLIQKKGKRVAESKDDEEEIGSNKRSTASKSTKDSMKSVGLSKSEIDSEYTSLYGKRTDLKLNSQKIQSPCIERLATMASITGEEKAIALEHVAKDDNLKITLLGLDDESLTSWIKLIAFERKNAIMKQRIYTR
ncbi:hypothetical protein AXF42_Ash015857 [Apostasia shenzhenica]|uniref:Uncharacterized protein n=1 Tax=Apostasia shenzhenica TaxID=1088818 RepID=A0A2H9ZXS6_9ASPA|nr:hypothetical protein AXF42_Ash015857 [Apostasia shenzhenica]